MAEALTILLSCSVCPTENEENPALDEDLNTLADDERDDVEPDQVLS